METLKRLGLDTNTLVVFASDQGLNAGHSGYWGMGDHSRPLNTCEATVRIPRMIRTPDWKLTVRHPYGPDELYDMKNDPGERENLIHVSKHAAVRKQLKSQLNKFFAKYANPKYDRWKGGATKGTEILKAN